MSGQDIAKILLVEDDFTHQRIIRSLLMSHAEFRCDVKVVETYEHAIQQLEVSFFDVILADYYLGDYTCTDLLSSLDKFDLLIPVIVLTDYPEIWISNEVLEKGAYHFLEKKGLSASLLIRTIRFAMRRYAMEQDLKESSHFDHLIINSLGEGVIVVDEEGLMVFVNPAAADILCADVSDLHNRHFMEIAQASESKEGFESSPIYQAFLRDTPLNGIEYQLRCLNGKTVFVECTATPFASKRSEHKGIVIVFEDVSDRKQIEEQLNFLACYDYLTKLPNRKLFEKTLNQALNRSLRNDKQMALLFLDLDNFKDINDTLGHDTGDILLSHVADRLKSCVRAGDTVARIGGDEFTVIAEGLNRKDQAAVIAKKIIDVLKPAFNINHQEVFVGTSIGIALFPEAGQTAEQLIKCSDTAMYHAKQQGRHNYQYYTSELNRHSQRRLFIENSLHKAIEDDQLYLTYQPRIEMKTGNVTGVEALLRWKCAERYEIDTAECIRLAEESGLIVPIGEWVLEHSLRQQASWFDKGLFSDKQRLAINLSSYQLIQKNLPKMIDAKLTELGLEANRIELEVTETALMNNLDTCKETVHALNEMGIRITLDDFGTGYSSFKYLKMLPIDAIKIDQSFVMDLPNQKDNQAIIKAMIGLADNLRMGIVAEGIETESEYQLLCEMGCEQAQGFYFCPPITPEKIGALLEKSQLGPSAVFADIRVTPQLMSRS